MKHTPGNGLPALPPELQTQESMNNVSAAMRNPDRPMQSLTAESYAWRLAIEAHYETLLCKIPHKRQDLLAEAFGCKVNQGKTRYTLPERLPASVSKPENVVWEDWAGKSASKMEFRKFLSEMTDFSKDTQKNTICPEDQARPISEGALSNTVFPDRVRPTGNCISALLKCLPMKEGARLRLYQNLGWHLEIELLTEEGKKEKLEGRKEKLKELLKEKWGLTSLNAAVGYLDLSSSTMDNVKNEWNLHVSTAYKFIIALGNPEEPLELYHLFRLHPIEITHDQKLYYGEECGVVMACLHFFDSLHRKMNSTKGMNLSEGSGKFFNTLKTLLAHYDEKYGKTLYGKLVSQHKEETDVYVPLPDGIERSERNGK